MIAQVHAPHDPRGWPGAASWSVEPVDAALGRCPPAGRAFFEALFAEFPALASAVEFLRRPNKPEEIWAVFDLPGGGFGVRAAADRSEISLWGDGGPAAFGDWHQDQLRLALDHVRAVIDRPRVPAARS